MHALSCTIFRKVEGVCVMKRKKNCLMTSLLVIISMLLCLYPCKNVIAAEPIVIVIDPGHGGTNLGTNYLPIPEKTYTMLVATYMKAYLEQYDNVKVYLTHTEDIDVSLQKRAEFAQSVNADFLYSLHFNMSSQHTLYGAEVWIPSESKLYTQGYSQANEFLKEFTEMGLFNRGIKTRISQKSGEDYYGIIRQCALRNIPAIIVEHCHVDHEYDSLYMASDDKLREFGERDARAVAKYFGLVSKDKSEDYREYTPIAIPIPEKRVWQDLTSPEYLKVDLINYDKLTKYATFTLSSKEQESYLQYYSYSFDDGVTWSVYQPWKSTSDTMTIMIKTGYQKSEQVMFKVLNQYDGETFSNKVSLKK